MAVVVATDDWRLPLSDREKEILKHACLNHNAEMHWLEINKHKAEKCLVCPGGRYFERVERMRSTLGKWKSSGS